MDFTTFPVRLKIRKMLQSLAQKEQVSYLLMVSKVMTTSLLRYTLQKATQLDRTRFISQSIRLPEKLQLLQYIT